MARLMEHMDKVPGQGASNSEIAHIAEVQSLLRSLHHSATTGSLNRALRSNRSSRRTSSTNGDEERASSALKRRMPTCRYQSLTDFEAGDAVLAQLNEGAARARSTISSSRIVEVPPSIPRPRSTTRHGSLPSHLAVNIDLAPARDESLMASAGRLPKLKSSSASRLPEGSTLAATRQPAPAKEARPVSREASASTAPALGRQSPELVMRPPSHYEATCAKQAMLPKFARTAQMACSNGLLDLTGSGLGDRQLTALLRDTSLVPLQTIRRWKLRDARLGDAGAAVLVDVLRDDVELIDLACNKMTVDGTSTLASLMCDRPLYKLRRLDLSGNAISDEALGALTEGLSSCHALLRLDMNSNSLRDGVKLGNFVANHSLLTRLSLRRNYLSGEGTAALFDGVLKNSKSGYQLADLDVAWNSIGSSNSMRAANAIAAVLRDSAALYHIDISYNGIDAASCGVLADGVRDNHSLYGLHIVGNAVTMDADGFLTPLDDENIHQQMQGRPNPRFGDLMPQPQAFVGASKAFNAAKRMADDLDVNDNSVQVQHFQSSRNGLWSIDDDLRGRDVSERQTACWACEGWERAELEWPLEPGLPEPKAVWAFTSLDAFRKGLRMQRTQGRLPGQPPRFVAARMVPPNWRLQVVFQVDTAIRVPQGCQTEVLNPPVHIKLRACEELQNLEPPHDQKQMVVEWIGPIPTMRVERAGILDRRSRNHMMSALQSDLAKRRSMVLDGLDGGPPVTMLRITETEFKITVKVARGRSFYADFRREDPNLYKQCFALDWSRCRLDRLVPESEAPAIQALLEVEYGKLMALYRKYSALDVNGETELGVTLLQASEIIVTAGLGGDNITKIADIDRFFIAAKVTPQDLKKELVVVNDKSLVRYELLEFMVRIAHQRFLSTGKAENLRDAIVMLLDALDNMSSHELKLVEDFLDAFHCEAVDDVMKKHNDLIETVYKRHSGSRTLPGRPKTMVLIEFQRLMELLDVYDNDFQARLSGVAFRMGMMTQRDESGASRFQDMTLVEFLHALGAVVFLKENFDASKFAALMDNFLTNTLPLGLKAAEGGEKRSATKRLPTKQN